MLYVLTGYPETVVASVCNPRTGLPSKGGFPPNVYEITTACEAIMRPLRALEARRKREAEEAADAAKPISEADLERRREVVRAWRESEIADMEANTPEEMELADARKIRNPELKAKVADYWTRRLEQNAARNAAVPCKLSPEALALMGIGREAAE